METSIRLVKNKGRLWTLFKTCFIISACTFGGGMVIISLLQKKFVEELGWIDQDEVMDLTAIAQSCPGVMAVNTSIMIGYRICGPLGAVITAVGTVLPPMIILSVISLFYTQFRSNRIIAIALQVMRAGVAAVIFDVVINLAKNVIATKRTLYILLMATAFVGKVILGVDAMIVILCCLVVGLVDLAMELRSNRKVVA